MRLRAIYALIVVCVSALTPCFAQEPDAPQSLSAAQLDSLTAPIALYPDALIAQILTAATYPLEVVEAAHWLDDPNNAGLTGDSLAAALESQNWDLSVKSLVPFPDILQMMERNLQWTEQIGDAFLAQQADVMDSIQRLRQRAVSAGTLRSSPQQAVRNEDGEVVVEPVNPDVVYLPYYDPSVAYGPWPWPGYVPFSFPPPAGIYLRGPVIVFGLGFPVIRPLWGWSYWNWPRHGLFIPPTLPRASPLRPGPWRHDPDHRRGFPYRDRDHEPAHTERPLTPGELPRPRIPPPRWPREGDRTEHPPVQRPPGREPARGRAPPLPGQPSGDHPPQHRPRTDQSAPAREPPARRPAPPGGEHPPGDDRSRNRSPVDRPWSPSATPRQGGTPSGRLPESRPRGEIPAPGNPTSPAQGPKVSPRGGATNRPQRDPDRPVDQRGQDLPRKPQ